MDKQISNTVLPYLYKHHLFVIKEGVENDIDEGKQNMDNNLEVSSSLQWLGKNLRQITIVIRDEENKFLKEDDLRFLLNILNACHLTVDDIAIVNIAHTPTTLEALSNTLHTKVCLFFGVNPQVLKVGVPCKLYQPSQADNCMLLVAHFLNKLNGNTPEQKTEKAKLWNALKQLFNI